MALLSKEAILKAPDITTEDVPVKEWDGTIRLRSLTGKQRDDFEGKMVDTRGKSAKMNFANMRARLLSLCIVDENNDRVFTDIEVNLLGEKSASVLDRLFEKARDMNGMSDKDIEELTEGFDSGQSVNSTSA